MKKTIIKLHTKVYSRQWEEDGYLYPVGLKIEVVSAEGFPTYKIFKVKNNDYVDIIGPEDLENYSEEKAGSIKLKFINREEMENGLKKIITKIQVLVEKWEKLFKEIEEKNIYYKITTDKVEEEKEE